MRLFYLLQNLYQSLSDDKDFLKKWKNILLLSGFCDFSHTYTCQLDVVKIKDNKACYSEPLVK